VPGKKNPCVIRSGQDWSDTLPEERSLYLETMHPVLIKGVNFLRDNGREVGCYNMNLWHVLDGERHETSLEKTFGLGYFDDLSSLERWSKSHLWGVSEVREEAGQLPESTAISRGFGSGAEPAVL
jgi:hypothetical protein